MVSSEISLWFPFSSLHRKIFGWDVGLRPVGERDSGECDAVFRAFFAFVYQRAIFRSVAILE